MGVAAKSPTRFRKIARAGVLAGALGSLTAATSDQASYPTGFQRWEHVHSGVVLPGSPAYPGFGGIHDTYGNAIAMRGYPAGKYADGSVFVFDVHHEVVGKGSIEPAKRRQVDVMVKRKGVWDYFEFKGDSRTELSVTVAQGRSQCAGCHDGAKRDHVFREEDAAPAMPSS